ncbi:MAG: putative lipid II flippase FtsW [Actinomycetota bacterium]|nr:putative lipid II flippase FtsW [Actinomycetota bacterium]
MSTASRPPGGPTDGLLAGLRQSLERPLASYHVVRGVTGLLLALGLLMVLSASSVESFYDYGGNSYAVFLRQVMWVAIGLPAAWVASRLPLPLIGGLSTLGLLVSVGLLAATYVPGLGTEVNGNQNWLSFGGPFRIQPSELAKLTLVLWVAHVYARKGSRLDEWRHLLLPMVPVSLLVAGLVVGQRDLGTALVLFAIILGLLWVVGAPFRLFGGAVVLAGGTALFLASLSPARMARLTSFTDPFADYDQAGWQAAHGFFALANGGWWGVGLGASVQKWEGKLPEAHNDFIFAIIGEELGLFGTLLVLLLFGLLVFAGFGIAARTRDPFARYAAAGITIWLAAQAVINIGMVLGLLPVIGIPLPLVSYGGSALVPTLVALGVLVNLAKTEPGAAAAWRPHRRHGTAARWGFVRRPVRREQGPR